ncbi:MAG: EAL domain-containing protein [Nocardioidaceae bacterium]|nr:EAL domain-containing protein [Nocardioidaceae bacterium]
MTPAIPGLRAETIHSVFQPVVDLHEASVVGFEALARGPEGPLQSPMAMLAEARAHGQMNELDALFRESALRYAAEAGISAPLTLFVNADPAALDEATLDAFPACDPSFLGVVEITERALMSRPAQLMAAVDRLRDLGWGIALDDLGSDPSVAAVMPLVEPDVIKLDMRLAQSQPDHVVAEVVCAVRAHAEATDCQIVAEGIETADHYAAALAMGADLGQGMLLGEPARLPEAADKIGALGLRPRARTLTPGGSPFACLPPGRAPRRASTSLLLELSQHLEREARRIGPTAVLLSSFQHQRYYSPETRRRYGVLGRRLGLVGVLGQGLTTSRDTSVKVAGLERGDPMASEWDVVVLSPHFAAALLAREIDDGYGVRGSSREFEYQMTFDRDVVVAAARTLMSRLR